MDFTQNGAIDSQNFLAFYLNGKNYAFPILKVSEVIVLPEITPMPKVPDYMKGVINLRGQIIPIVDLRLALNLNNASYNEQTCVVIVQMHFGNLEKLVGFIVDCVSEVFEIPITDIESPPSYGKTFNEDFLKGIGKVKDKIIMLLDIDKILSQSETHSFMHLELENSVV
jgi:purine-binding chemotaxis protein CheW